MLCLHKRVEATHTCQATTRHRCRVGEVACGTGESGINHWWFSEGVPSGGAVNGGVSPPLTVEAGNGTSQDYADVARFLGTLHGGDDWQV